MKIIQLICRHQNQINLRFNRHPLLKLPNLVSVSSCIKSCLCKLPSGIGLPPWESTQTFFPRILIWYFPRRKRSLNFKVWFDWGCWHNRDYNFLSQRRKWRFIWFTFNEGSFGVSLLLRFWCINCISISFEKFQNCPVISINVWFNCFKFFF